MDVNDVYSHYKVIQKLEFGGYSTVWFSVDTEFNLLETFLTGRTNITVALKALARNSSRREVDVMLRLKAEALRKGLKEENVVSLIDHFEHTGPKGKHLY